MKIRATTTLIITARGQITLYKKEVLQHPGVRRGERIELDKLPDGRILFRARPSGKTDRSIGLLAGKSKTVTTLDEISGAAASRWAGQK